MKLVDRLRGFFGLKSLQIWSPVEGGTLSGVATIRVNSSGVQRVNFYVDGVLKGRDRKAPFTFDWYTTNYSDGTHTIKVVGSDGHTSDSASYIVKNSTPTPTPTTSVYDKAQYDLDKF